MKQAAAREDDYHTCEECNGKGKVKDKETGKTRDCPICDGEGIRSDASYLSNSAKLDVALAKCAKMDAVNPGRLGSQDPKEAAWLQKQKAELASLQKLKGSSDFGPGQKARMEELESRVSYYK